jgi:hypothetical protein
VEFADFLDTVSRFRRREFAAFSGQARTSSGREAVNMTINPQPRQVRRIVVRAIAQLEAKIIGVSDLDEQILVDEGHVARSYKVGGYLAMWLVEVGVLQFYDAEGNMIKTINLLEQPKLAA